MGSSLTPNPDGASFMYPFLTHGKRNPRNKYDSPIFKKKRNCNSMSDEINVLLKFCEEEWTQRRQSENQRSLMTNILMTAAMAIVVIIIQKGLVIGVIPLASLLIFTGTYGALTTAKFYERGEAHMARARQWRKRIDELCPQAKLIESMSSAHSKHNERYPILTRVRLYFLWIFLHASIATIGCVILVALLLK